jgi:hypothetical protein
MEISPPLLTEEGVAMSETLLSGAAPADGYTAPEVTPLGEGRMVREDCWREVHRRYHVERRSKSEIAGALAHERDGHRIGAHAVARDAAGGLGGIGQRS